MHNCSNTLSIPASSETNQTRPETQTYSGPYVWFHWRCCPWCFCPQCGMKLCWYNCCCCCHHHHHHCPEYTITWKISSTHLNSSGNSP